MIMEPGGLMKLDLHIHSKYSSDGILGVEEIIKIAKRKGLDGIAITDHDTIKGGLKAKEYETKDFRIIIGCEKWTHRGEIIGLFLSEELGSKEAGSVIDEIRKQNGLIVIPHPFDEMRHSAFRLSEDDTRNIDAIEVFNSRCVFQKYNDTSYEYAKARKLATVAGSDAHFANEIGLGGITTKSEDVKEAILKHDVEIFGKRSSVINHGRTKVLKLWRKLRSG
jgi:predicted metal-dependent phosphoesterase TrpH